MSGKSMSGIEVTPEVSALFNKVKLKHSHKFVGFKITDDKKKVVVDEDFCGEPVDTKCCEDDKKCFEEFKKRVLCCSLPRYLLYDFQFRDSNGRLVNKLAFFNWSRDDAPVHQKMIYSATKDSVKKAFVGVGIEFQVNEPEELDYDDCQVEVLKKANS